MDPTDHDSRRELLKELLGAFGEGSEIRPPLQCDYGYQTTVGARSFANWGLVLLDVATVTIGDDVQLGQMRGSRAHCHRRQHLAPVAALLCAPA